jgi:hypothetical protein
MNNENIQRIGNVELTFDEAFKLYQENKYIVTYSKIYQLFFSTAQNKVYGQVIYNQKGLARRGRFYAFSGEQVNNLVKAQLVNV